METTEVVCGSHLRASSQGFHRLGHWSVRSTESSLYLLFLQLLAGCFSYLVVFARCVSARNIRAPSTCLDKVIPFLHIAKGVRFAFFG